MFDQHAAFLTRRFRRPPNATGLPIVDAITFIAHPNAKRRQRLAWRRQCRTQQLMRRSADVVPAILSRTNSDFSCDALSAQPPPSPAERVAVSEIE
jgi:hypothetical protein